MLTCLILARTLPGCPFCGAVAPTLADNLAEAERAVIAVPVAGQVAPEVVSLNTTCSLRVIHGLKGDVCVEQIIDAPLVENLDPSMSYLVISLPQEDQDGRIAPQWAYTVSLTPSARDYLRESVKLNNDDPRRLSYYQPFLQSEDAFVAKDAHGEFAKASYAALLEVKDGFDRQWLINSIQDIETPPQRQRLYWMLLSTCGHTKDAELFDSLLQRRDDGSGFELEIDTAMACYGSLGGVSAIERLEQDYIAKDSGESNLAGDAIAAVQALRFHLSEPTGLPRARVQQAMHLVLQRRDLADFVIPDLARLNDWSAIDRIFELFVDADEENAFVKTQVVNYLRVCPLPQAKEYLEQCKKLDPAAVRRSEILYRLEQP